MLEREAREALRPRLAEARGIAEHTVEELRRLVAALSPAVLERLGLRTGAPATGGAVPQDAPGRHCGVRFSGDAKRFPGHLRK